MHNDIMAEHILTWLNGHKIHAGDVLYDLNWISFAAAVSALFVPTIVVLNVIFSGALRPFTLVFTALIHMAPAKPSVRLKPLWFHNLSCFLHHKSSRLLAFFCSFGEAKVQTRVLRDSKSLWKTWILHQHVQFMPRLHFEGFGLKMREKIKPKYNIISKAACGKGFCFSQLRLKFI